LKHNWLDPGLPGQPFERGVCAVPRRVKVAAIKRDKRARRFEDCVRLIRREMGARIIIRK
jgi:ribosomal protein L31E